MRRGILFLLMLAGCSGSSKQLRVVLRPAGDMNDTRSCYVLARTVDDKLYGTETYDDVAGKAMSPDGSVLQTLVMVPGVPQEIRLPVPDKGRIALYALFEQPEDSSWRVMLPASVTDGVEVRLARARICWSSPGARSGAVGVCSGQAVQVKVR